MYAGIRKNALFASLLASIIVNQASAQQPLPQRDGLIYRLPEAVELQPSPESELVIPNFTALQLPDAVEISVRMELAPTVTGYDGFDYVVDLEAGTYTATYLRDHTVSNDLPPPEPLEGTELLEIIDEQLQTGVASFNRYPSNVMRSESAGCGSALTATLWVELTTRDPAQIPLARTTQDARWVVNNCTTTLTYLNREYWANSDTVLFNTTWYVLSTYDWESPRYVPLDGASWAGAYGRYRNDDFLDDSAPTYAIHRLYFFIMRRESWWHDVSFQHYGQWSNLLRGTVRRNFNTY
ncbi:MAG: hypothetical protein F4234_11210 [Gammaproteobacteria bacterium]|nr:hypothetical protein [Gammaproteobacteria bacterium]MXX06284.1 hypothetical protein [Gammaproteobacteria bacterium]MXY89415.1 hypothetical protein [Gammaproteobacteria bacterium]MYE28491.1 hypothetical protein [Gammaproteobacteria bacterium]MYF00715.1 hypothetical protein [Gammaproteobacteria bacterium]